MVANVAANLPQENDSDTDSFLDDVLHGLGKDRKSLNPKYFYDESGSRLFELITELPEYYITRTETRLMQDIAEDIGHSCEETQVIVEFGSGSGQRSEILISALPELAEYVPIDVSPELLEATAKVVTTAHPQILVKPVVADFTSELCLPAADPNRRLGYFPGSTIGNFSPGQAHRFLSKARQLLGSGSRMLVGVDLVKPLKILERAYNDSEGVTAAFNKNILNRINMELDADFNLGKFAHQAFFNEDQSRIEMHLVSLEEQQVQVNGAAEIQFRAGESIHTENSYKYTPEGFRSLAQEAGWQTVKYWSDSENLFSLHLLESG